MLNHDERMLIRQLVSVLDWYVKLTPHLTSQEVKISTQVLIDRAYDVLLNEKGDTL